MKRFLFAAALLVCISPLARAEAPLLLNAVVLPCEANSKNLELMELSDSTVASPAPTPCPELAPPVAAPSSESVPPPAVAEKPSAGNVAKARNILPPEKASPVRFTQFEKPPVIDGKVDDEAWKSAALFKDFYQWQPSDSSPAPARTEVRAGYDSRFIYLAFYAFDDPARIRASIARGDSIFDDDTVGLILDTFNEKRRAYELFFNPLGIQTDSVLTKSGNDDSSVDIGMESKGSLTADGYVVELAIPFKALRYEGVKRKLWGVHVLRQIKHRNWDQYSWMPIAKDQFGLLRQAGQITGLEGISARAWVSSPRAPTLRQNVLLTPRERLAFEIALTSNC